MTKQEKLETAGHSIGAVLDGRAANIIASSDMTFYVDTELFEKLKQRGVEIPSNLQCDPQVPANCIIAEL